MPTKPSCASALPQYDQLVARGVDFDRVTASLRDGRQQVRARVVQAEPRPAVEVRLQGRVWPTVRLVPIISNIGTTERAHRATHSVLYTLAKQRLRERSAVPDGLEAVCSGCWTLFPQDWYLSPSIRIIDVSFVYHGCIMLGYVSINVSRCI